jgi:hypothetical protein
MADYPPGRIAVTFLKLTLFDIKIYTMNYTSGFSSLKKITATYSTMLTVIPDTDFQTAPAIGGWSYSEVYAHIFDASMLTLDTLEDCIHGKGKIRSTPFVTKLILFFGALPPGRYKTPKILAGRVRVITKEEAHKLISNFTEKLDLVSGYIDKANPAIKTLHPRMGYLNAGQWLKFIGIHLKHHLKQLKRVQKSF